MHILCSEIIISNVRKFYVSLYVHDVSMNDVKKMSMIRGFTCGRIKTKRLHSIVSQFI